MRAKRALATAHAVAADGRGSRAAVHRVPRAGTRGFCLPRAEHALTTAMCVVKTLPIHRHVGGADPGSQLA